MKAVCLTSKGNFKLQDVPEPELEHDSDVKIRVAYAGMCGDDVHVLRGDMGSFTEMQIMGDEMSGIVVAVGKTARQYGFQEGDWVSGLSRSSCGKCAYCLSGNPQACKNSEPHGVMSEYVVLTYTHLCHIPPKLGLKTGELMSLVALCAKCVSQANIGWGDSVAIMGAGGMGLVCLQLARRHGAGQITVIEPVDSKRELALSLGATHVINPLTENVFSEAYRYTDDYGFSSVIEASGSTTAFNNAISIVGNLGTLVVPSVYHLDFKYPLDMMDFLWRQITICGVRSPSPLQQTKIVELMEQLDLSVFTNHVFPIESAGKAYEAFTSGLYPKILLKVDHNVE